MIGRIFGTSLFELWSDFMLCPAPMSTSSSRRDKLETDVDAGDGDRVLEASGETESAEEIRGGDERACAIDCAASERRREARFWFLENVVPFCSSPHFLPTLPIQEIPPAVTEESASPGMEDTGTNVEDGVAFEEGDEGGMPERLVGDSDLELEGEECEEDIGRPRSRVVLRLTIFGALKKSSSASEIGTFPSSSTLRCDCEELKAGFGLMVGVAPVSCTINTCSYSSCSSSEGGEVPREDADD